MIARRRIAAQGGQATYRSGGQTGGNDPAGMPRDHDSAGAICLARPDMAASLRLNSLRSMAS
ncbi:hypothetical protein EBBID32_7370 [Sphingobium indicum BiD32]|uniref:Uncharacterized protein n=2 Tax=Sphingomonadaceae TaxID=41297 RepID=N1MHE8_9SPHN|nr:hypothetical protein EBBID32_7370 [Sphingobium indicum BiD32]